ncbi:MAG TPA: mercuric transporter MerT family protein [Steroidobacteraceae bacterium]|nr:mercuric transporter MerT family protein [Steroidobacteraceae bacterium]
MEDLRATDRQARARCNASGQTAGTKWTTVGSVFAAIGVCVSCCLLPLALAALGLGGAWVGGLKTFVPYKPIFVIIASGLLVYGFYVVYWRRNTACVGEACTSCLPGRSARVGLWVATILGASSVLFDYLEPYLFGS